MDTCAAAEDLYLVFMMLGIALELMGSPYAMGMRSVDELNEETWLNCLCFRTIGIATFCVGFVLYTYDSLCYERTCTHCLYLYTRTSVELTLGTICLYALGLTATWYALNAYDDVYYFPMTEYVLADLIVKGDAWFTIHMLWGLFLSSLFVIFYSFVWICWARHIENIPWAQSVAQYGYQTLEMNKMYAQYEHPNLEMYKMYDWEEI